MLRLSPRVAPRAEPLRPPQGGLVATLASSAAVGFTGFGLLTSALEVELHAPAWGLAEARARDAQAINHASATASSCSVPRAASCRLQAAAVIKFLDEQSFFTWRRTDLRHIDSQERIIPTRYGFLLFSAGFWILEKCSTYFVQ